MASLRVAQATGVTHVLAALARVRDHCLAQELFVEGPDGGTVFPSPIGLAAGFDKDARVVRGMAALGFGFLELGTVTPRPQRGNPRPRMFRLVEDESLLNRLGFNNRGGQAFHRELERLGASPVPLGINLGKNKDTPDDRAIHDYAELAALLGDFGSYVVLNVSSPNTPGLRDLQSEVFLSETLAAVRERTARPVLVKLAPDLEAAVAGQLVRAALSSGAAGIVASNTTNEPELLARHAAGLGAGGISGRLLRERSRRLLEVVTSELAGEGTVISVGGIASVSDVWERLAAGARLVQVYSALVFQGPGLIARLERGLVARLATEGLVSIGELVGRDRVA